MRLSACLPFALFLSISVSFAQVPYGPIKPTPSSEILLNLERLNVLGTVLYVAAHPDDENTLLLAYMAKDRLVRTGLPFADAGRWRAKPHWSRTGRKHRPHPNAGTTGRPARDGPDQFFSRAYDFGFSKSTDEAVQTWGKDKVLSDVVWVIRKYRPDVIHHSLPARCPRRSRAPQRVGFSGRAGVQISGDATKFPEQLAFVKPWQAKRIMWNAYNPRSFTSNTAPDEPGNISVSRRGVFNPLLGRSYGEIAAESRSQHRSQGFGVAPNRGNRTDYLLLKDGDPVTKDPFDGVDLSWNRVANSGAVQTQVKQVISQFQPANPAASVPALAQLYGALGQLDTTNIYIKAKRKDVEELIWECLGLWLEANPVSYAATPGESIKVISNLTNRADVPVQLLSIRYSTGQDTTLNLPLKPNVVALLPTTITIPKTAKFSQPYWLEKPIDKGVFRSITSN